ncbi:HD domain-containing protein [Desulfomonile tiedjei]|nr:HD domain-containing protein [Desulfomonile tiedjei]
MCDIVFPGASHSRLAHSLGVMHLARRVLDQIKRVYQKMDEIQRRVVLLAALLHDIGHGPFSHAFERVSDSSHESWTGRIILDETTEVHQKLKELDPTLPKQVADFLQSKPVDGVPTVFSHIVSSQLDVDRFDYLLRDSHATGTNYGAFDLNWLIQHLFLTDTGDRFYLDRKAYWVAKAYIFARHNMYQTVYFHKAVRATEVMFVELCSLYRNLVKEAADLKQKKAIAPNVSPVIVSIFSEDAISLDDYLTLDDSTLIEFFKCCAHSSHLALAALGLGLINRKLYKCIDITMEDKGRDRNFVADVSSWLTENHMDWRHEFISDSPANTPYQRYMPEKEKPAQAIYIERPDGNQVEITEYRLQSPIAALAKENILARYYFKEAIRDKVDELAKAHGLRRA